ncbi:MAG: lamin tail domain-containing protein, partial [Candidatus Marinimicrobia bacterium]|nr:lamin tail domain-containing protein [Candidatus Neomarinimicrobiota bacterium]
YDGECAYAIYNAAGEMVAEAGTADHPDLELTFTVTPPVPAVWISEYAEGSSNNNYLEIYNGTGADVDLTGMAFPTVGNDPTVPGEYEYWNEFPAGATVAAGDVYVIAHPEADAAILAEADHTFTYLSNGDDGLCLVVGTEGAFAIVVCIGDWWGDPGSGWDVAGVTNATQNHTLQRNWDVSWGNEGDWASSAGTSTEDSEWTVLDNEDWTGLGSHTTTFPCDDTEFTVTVDGGSWQSEVTWSVTDEDGAEVVSGAAPITVADDVTACLADGVYTLNMYDAYGDGWNGNIFTLWTYDGTDYTEFFSATLESGSEGTAAIIVGESDDVFGCTDPDAINYNPDATLDDGSCYYAGDQCDIALDFVAAGGATDGSAAVEAATTAAGDVDWYTFTLDQDWENLTVSLSGSAFDTQLDVYSDCETLLGYNDDYDGVQSQVDLFSVTAGTYHCQVYGYGSAFGNYTLTINAFMDPTNPTNLSALGGLERVYLSFDPAQPAGTAASAGGGFQGTVDEHIQWQYDNKKEPVNADIPLGRSREAVIEEMQNNDTQTRDTEVLVTLFDSYGDGHYGGDSDGDAYVVDADGNTLHTLEGPWTGSSATFGPFTLADGTYSVEWDPTAPWLSEQTMEVVLASDTSVVLGFGAAPSACFALGDGNSCSNPDLTVDNVTFDNWTGRATVTVSNIGGQDAGYFYTMAFIQEPDTTQTYPPGYFQYAWEGTGLAAGATADFYLATYLTLPGFVGGYDDETYTVYAMADGYGNYVLEESEGNNVGSTTVVNSNPLGNSTWNVWRDGAVVDNISAPAWQPGASVLYTDEPLTADVEYCYMVTQVDGTTETAASNESCATPSAPPDVPEPTDLAGSSSGFDVTLTWTAPEPYEGTAIFSGTPSSTRQGGEDIENATVITELGQLTGTTAGYADDYDEVCPYVGGGATDVVYSFTPETDVAVNLTTCYSSFDTKMYIYANEVGVLATTITGTDACSDDTYPPGVDDCTAWTSYIEGAWMTAGNTYYLVIDGYGASQGDYIVDVELYNPLAGYTVWSMGDDGSASPVGQAGPTATEWNTVLFAAEPTDLDLALTADYNIPGIFDPVISDVVGPVTVTVQI